jgi:hypothetical protein
MTTTLLECQTCADNYMAKIDTTIGYKNGHDDQWHYISRRLYNTTEVQIVSAMCERHQKLLNLLAASKITKYL